MKRLSLGLPVPTRLGVFAWVFAVTVACIALVVTGARASRASANMRSAEAEIAAARKLSSDLAIQKSSTPGWMSARREETSLAPRLTKALAAAGLPSATMSSFSVQRESNIGGKELGAARERATCVLSGLTLPQLGRVLATWREREPQWTPTSFDISPTSSAGSQSAAVGGDMPLRVVLTLESVYVEDRSETRASSSATPATSPSPAPK